MPSYFDYRETAKDLVEHSRRQCNERITAIYYGITPETPGSVTQALLHMRNAVDHLHNAMWSLLNRSTPPPAEPTALAAIREILMEQVECDVVVGMEGSTDPHPSYSRILYAADLRTSEAVIDGFDHDSIIPLGLCGVWKSDDGRSSCPVEFRLKSIDLENEKAVYAVTESEGALC